MKAGVAVNGWSANKALIEDGQSRKHMLWPSGILLFPGHSLTIKVLPQMLDVGTVVHEFLTKPVYCKI